MAASSSASTSSARNNEPLDQNVAGPLYQVKLLAALRSGDPALIHPFLAELSKSKSSEGGASFGPAALHLAIRCASRDTVALFLSHRSISPNAVYPPGSGTTALNLAASIGRADIVSLLLEQPDIDDTLKDANGKTCKDIARGKDVQNAIRESRSLLTASYRALLHSYIESPPKSMPPQELLNLLSSPRAKLIDLSYLDAQTGRSLLHEAARRRDLRLIELSVRAGADVFVRDKRGKGVGQGAGLNKDDKVRVFLRQFTNQDISLLESSTSEPITMKGYLNKFTNVAKGYSTRWFVIQDGVLSYYRHQDDEGVASRGAISLKGAVLKHNTVTASDRLRFEIHSAPTRPGSTTGQQKWYVKGNHVVEVNRWVQALVKAISWYNADEHEAWERGGGNESESDGRSPSLRASVTGHFGTISGSIHRLRSQNSGQASISSIEPDGDRDHHRESSAEMKSPVVGGSIHSVMGDAEDPAVDDSSSEVQSERPPPHESTFTLHGNSILAQMEVTAQLWQNFDFPSPLREPGAAVQESFSVVQKMMSEYLQMAQEREDWWKAQLEKERKRGALWEESLQVAVQEGDALEKELKSRIRRKSRMLTVTDGTLDHLSTIRRRSSAIRSTPFITSPATTPTPETVGLPAATTSVFFQMQGNPEVLPTVPDQPEVITPVSHSPPPIRPVSPMLMRMPSQEHHDDVGDEADTDEEDEFFDAIDSNNIPNLVVAKALTSASEITLPSSLPVDAYKGYMHLRDRLPIDADNRPPTSLWSVLKHSIGKDLTKISFPVFFNEPTSMLQRMAEDMEFSECLDAAVIEENPHKRIAFVAAFAMSNYSSTIGRIAKPFNPMLSETFEYVRFDKHYRYVSEQVSHHPPISACWAESPLWHYYGEVDAQNKFMGKSFEIRPTGVAHTELKIPEKFGPNYPKYKGAMGEGKVVEHYSWKKVTTNVSGFILGSPTIDHYGDMTVTNHRTGDTCTLTFKPRGWRGRDAYEIYGRVMDASGHVIYEIAGRWNSQLVARSIAPGHDPLSPDVSLSPPSSPSAAEYILLWRNTQKPKAPFNLTPFAITLNDCPEDTLKPYLCPTDCRLRPDQRAFELGRFDTANDLKNKQEEYQRATRKGREEGRLPPHQPRWFTASTDGDTGERVWEPARTGDGALEYWKLREGIYTGKNGWIEVDNIFIDEEP